MLFCILFSDIGLIIKHRLQNYRDNPEKSFTKLEKITHAKTVLQTS